MAGALANGWLSGRMASLRTPFVAAPSAN